MSFILDALRRADRERESERAAVPSLYTQAAPPLHAQARGDDDAAPRPWLWLAAGLGAGLVLAAVWALWSATPSSPPAPAAVPPPIAAVPEPAVPAAPQPTPAPAPTPPTVAPPSPPPPTARAEAPREQALTPPVNRSLPSKSSTARTTPEPAPPAPAQPPTRAAPPAANRDREVATRPPAPQPDADRSPAAAPAGPPIRQLGELSAEQRATLPALTIGGAMYSANAANRRLIVNGQLLRESDLVAPGVTLEEIRLKSAVLRTRDLRVEVGF